MRRIVLLLSCLFFMQHITMGQYANIQFNQYSAYTTTLENGNPVYIVFEDYGTSAATFEYSGDNGNSWTLIADNQAYQGSLGFYLWNIPGTLNGNIIVRVSQYGNPSVSAQAAATVSAPVPAYITITYPNGGESFNSLSDVTIRYNAHKVPKNGLNEEFKIEVSSNNGATWSTIASPAVGRQYTWQIPYNVTGNLKFRVSAFTNSAISDESDAASSVQANPVVNTQYKLAQNDVHGTVLAMAKDASGNIFVAGDFDFVDTIAANNIAMWNPTTGAWSKLGAGLDTVVRAVAVYNGEVYVGGTFDLNMASRTAVGIKKYNLSSGVWSNVASITQETNCTIACPVPQVSMISFDNSFMYVAGFYKTIEGNPIKHAAKRNLSNGSWSKFGFHNYPDSYTIEAAIEYYYVDGAEGYYISENDSLIRLNVATNSLVEKYSMKVNTLNDPIMMDAVKVGDTLFYIARYKKTTTYDYQLYAYNTVTKQFGPSIKINSGSNFAYPKITFWNNRIICALGTQGTYKSTATNLVGIPSNISLVFTGTPRCLITTNDNRLIIGGTITVANQASSNYTRKPVSGVCILDVNDAFGRLSSTTYFGLYTAASGLVKNGNHLYVSAGQSYIGASFENSFGNVRTSNGRMFKGIAQWDGDSLKWKGLGTGLHKGSGGPLSYAGEVNQLIDKDTLLIAGGYFDTGDSGTAVDIWTSQLGPRYIPLNNVAIWYKGSRRWGKMGAGTNGRVHAMVLAGEDVYFGGMFTTAGGLNTQLAKYNLLSKQWTSLNVTDEVRLMVTDGSSIFMAGQFIDQLPGGVVCNGLTRYDIGTSTFSNISGSFSDHSISAMTLDGNYLYMANYDGHSLVKFDKTNNTYVALYSAALTSNGMGGTINSLVVSGSYLYIGGLFDAIGGIQTKNFAVYNLNTGTFSSARRATLDLAGANGEVKYMTVYDNTLYAAGGFTILNKKFSGGLGTVPVAGSVNAIHNFLSNAAEEQAMVCYPNPASSEIRINDKYSSYSEVKILNAQGQEVKKATLKGDRIIEVEDLQPGIYEVILYGDQEEKVQKLVIQK